MTRTTGPLNVLHDLGLEDAADLTVHAQRAIKLNDLIDLRQLTRPRLPP